MADISFEDEDDQQLCLDECRAYWADIIGHAKTEDVPKLHRWFIQQMDAIKNKGNELYGYYEEVLYNDFDDPASLKWKLERIDAESSTMNRQIRPKRFCIVYLKKLSTYPEGLELARKIAQEWCETYRNRRAMKDELSKAGF